MSATLPYDRNDIKSILNYAQKLIGMSFNELLQTASASEEKREQWQTLYGNPKRKGGLGNLLEEVYFQYQANSDSRSDFHEVGLELKLTPYERSVKQELRVAERLVLSMIDYTQAVEKDLLSSHLWEKIAQILLIFYLRNRALASKLDQTIDYVSIFTPSEADLLIIAEDYRKIISKIEQGLAHELSEGDTLYLAACTKGATAAKSLAPQFYNKSVKAKKRAFSFKTSYMSAVLRQIASRQTEELDTILKSPELLKNSSFEDYVLQKLTPYIGKSDKELSEEIFEEKYSGNKAQWITLAYRMLGIKTGRAEEFVKANIAIKAIRLEEDGTMNESLSFAPFKFKELAKETWPQSSFRRYFEETKFLFIVYQKQAGSDAYIFTRAKFWNMPLADLDGDAKRGWRAIVSKIKKGIIFTHSKGRILNDLPTSKDNRIIHIRPHAVKAAYQLKDGTTRGNITRDANLLPDGQYMTNQSFWLNGTFVVAQL